MTGPVGALSVTEFKDYYTILNVAEDASQDEIKKAYRRLARKYHPDVSTESDAESRFKELGEAYEALKDPERRRQYDELRRTAVACHSWVVSFVSKKSNGKLQ